MEEPSKSTFQRGSRSPRALNQRNTEAHGKGVRQALRKPEIDLPAGRSAVPQGQGDSILVRNPSPWVLGEGMLAPSSPDLNPMDYFIWSILEVNACVTSHAKVEALKASLKTAWVAFPRTSCVPRWRVPSGVWRPWRVLKGVTSRDMSSDVNAGMVCACVCHHNPIHSQII